MPVPSSSRRASARCLSLHHSYPSSLVVFCFAWRLAPALSSRLRLVLVCHIRALAYRTDSCCVGLRLFFVKALGIICRHSCRHVHPVRRHFPQSGCGISPNIAVFVVVAAHVCLVRARHQCAPRRCCLRRMGPSPGHGPEVGVSLNG